MDIEGAAKEESKQIDPPKKDEKTSRVPSQEAAPEEDYHVPLYFGMPARTVMGTVFGYCIGEFVKKFTKKLAAYAGGAIMFLAILAYNDWISVNWKKIDKDLLNLLFRG